MELKFISNVDQITSDLNSIIAQNPVTTPESIKFITNVDQVTADVSSINRITSTGIKKIDTMMQFIDDLVRQANDISKISAKVIAKPVVQSIPVASNPTQSSSSRDSIIGISKIPDKAKDFLTQPLTLKASVVTKEDTLAAISRLAGPEESKPVLEGSGLTTSPSGLKTITEEGLKQISSDIAQVGRQASEFISDPNTFYNITMDSEFTQRQFMDAVAKAGQDQKLTILSAEVDLTKPPENPNEYRAAAQAALDKYMPENAINGINKLIAEYYPELAYKVLDGTIDATKLYNNIRMYIDAEQGGGHALQQSQFAHTPADLGGDPGKSFNLLTPVEQQSRMAIVYKQAMADGCGAYVAATEVKGLLNQIQDQVEKSKQESWAKNGGLDDLVFADPMFVANQEVKEFVGSTRGQMVIGASLSAVGIGVGVLTGGTAVVAAGLLSAVFSITELPNLVQYAKSGGASALKAKGIDSVQREFNYEGASTSTQKLVDQLTYKPQDLSPETRKSLLDQSKKSYAALGKELADNYIFLQNQGSYNAKLQQYKDIGAMLNKATSSIDAISGAMLSGVPSDAQITITPPPGGFTKTEGYNYNGKEPVTLTVIGNKPLNTEYYDKDGRLIGTETTETYPGLVKTIASDKPISFQSLQEEQKAAEPSTVRPVTLYVAPGQTAEMLGKKYVGGESGTSFLIPAAVGTQASIKFTSDKGQTDILNTMVADSDTQFWYKELQPNAVEKTYATLNPNIEVGQRLFIDGKEIANPERAVYIDVTPGLHSVVIKEKDKEDYTSTVNAFAGTIVSVAGKGKEPFVAAKSGGGGGGGGGSSGGSSGYGSSKNTASSTPASVAWIVFGVGCTATDIYLDDVLIAPVIGQAYELAPGYHALKIVKAGFEDWIKNPNLFAGDKLTVNPVFYPLPIEEPVEEPVEPTETTLYRVYIDSTPSGSKIMLDGGWSGEWTPSYLDLQKGYYKVGVQRNGYKLVYRSLWVSDVIAWDSLADTLAQANGVDIS